MSNQTNGDRPRRIGKRDSLPVGYLPISGPDLPQNGVIPNGNGHTPPEENGSGVVFDQDTFSLLNHTFLQDATDETLRSLIKPTPSYVPHFSSVSGGVVVAAQLPPELVRMIDIVAMDPRIPMRNRSDVMREAAFHYLAALSDAFLKDSPTLSELIASEELLNLMADLRERQDRLYRVAVSLREMLCIYVGQNEIQSAMIVLRRFYTKALDLSPEERGDYLALIKNLPVAKYVAWHMWDWPERIDDTLLPETPPSTDGFMSDEGLPPSGLSAQHAAVSHPPSSPSGRGRPKIYTDQDHAEYHRNYMWNRRHPNETPRPLR